MKVNVLLINNNYRLNSAQKITKDVNFAANIEFSQGALKHLADSYIKIPVDGLGKFFQYEYEKLSRSLKGLLKVDFKEGEFVYETNCLNLKEYPAGDASMKLYFIELRDKLTNVSDEYWRFMGLLPKEEKVIVSPKNGKTKSRKIKNANK